MKVYTYTAPSHWACYLFYDDPTGLDAKDIKRVDRWIASIGLGAPVEVEEVGFMQYCDARLDGAFPFAADCSEYTFLSNKD
jgi:hypothetical protein